MFKMLIVYAVAPLQGRDAALAVARRFPLCTEEIALELEASIAPNVLVVDSGVANSVSSGSMTAGSDWADGTCCCSFLFACLFLIPRSFCFKK